MFKITIQKNKQNQKILVLLFFYEYYKLKGENNERKNIYIK